MRQKGDSLNKKNGHSTVGKKAAHSKKLHKRSSASRTKQDNISHTKKTNSSFSDRKPKKNARPSPSSVTSKHNSTKRTKKRPQPESKTLVAASKQPYKKKQLSVSPSGKKKRGNKRTHSRRNNTLFRFLNVLSSLLFYLLLLCLFLVALFSVLGQKKDYNFFGYRAYTVLTNSMAPQKDSSLKGFYAGDIAIVKNVPYDQLVPKDIITYKVGEHAYLTHRLIRKEENEQGNYLLTKGDANNSEDPLIRADRLIGKVVFTIPYVGWVIEFIKLHKLVSFIFVASLISFFIVIRYIITLSYTSKRNQKKRMFYRYIS